MEGLAERNCDLARAMPAHFQDSRFLARKTQRRAKARGRAARVNDEIAIARRVVGPCVGYAERRGEGGARRIDVDERDMRAGKPGAKKGGQRADDACADDRNPVRGSGRRVPKGIEGGFHIGRQHSAPGRQALGQRGCRPGGQVEGGLMRMQRKDEPALQPGRSAFDPTDRRIAIFDGKRESASHERAAHPLAFTLGNAARRNQPFGAPADRAVKRAHANLAGPGLGEGLAADFGAAGRDMPESLRAFLWLNSRHTGLELLLPLYPSAVEKAGAAAAMLNRSTAPGLIPIGAALGRRRALFVALVIITIISLIALAAAAVPPASFGGALFLFCFAATLPWSAVGFWNAAIGFLIMRLSRDPVVAVNPMAARTGADAPIASSTAILMCVRNENPRQVTHNLWPLLQGLAGAGVADKFSVYVLSDSNDPDIIVAEEACFAAFAAHWRGVAPVVYRRRPVNTGFKAGNIRDFCDRWGAGHEFAVVMDADSFMPAETVLRLVRVMQANPTLGILQTLVIGLPSTSPFARLFQFGMRLGMRSYTLGAAWWQGDCGPYWGHNAILRLAPFIAHCDLPALARGGPILSHDQVEAALMRRAGFEVRVLPEEAISWEENPPTLIEHIRRDLRWCEGNMQYWPLLALPGLKPVSRFQLLFAILMYLGSPAWMAMVAIGAVTIALGRAPDRLWSGAGAILFAIIMVMIFAPKIASSLDVLARAPARRSYGGAAQFIGNVAAETLFSFLLSPILAFSHTLFLMRLLARRRDGVWNSQQRESHSVPWRLAWARLWLHTLVGMSIIGLAASRDSHGFAYALMAAGGLALSVPFAIATAAPSLGALFARLGLGRIPEEAEPPHASLALRLSPAESGAARML